MNKMPPVTKNLLIINFLMFFGAFVAKRYGIDLDDVLGLHFFLASHFRLHQFFTYMFMHAGVEHILLNMFALWMFGRIIEQVMGSKRFLTYYIICGLGAGLTQECAQYVNYLVEGLGAYEGVNVGGGTILSMSEYLNLWNTVGASGAIYGILLAFGMTFPEEKMFIIPIPVPIKAKWFVLGYAVIELLSAFSNKGDHVAHMAHLGGMLFGFAMIMYWRRRPMISSSRPSLWQRIKTWWQERQKPKMDIHIGGKHGDDLNWNYEKQQRQAEVDRILDKLKKVGYENLTEEEKKKLFK